MSGLVFICLLLKEENGEWLPEGVRWERVKPPTGNTEQNSESMSGLVSLSLLVEKNGEWLPEGVRWERVKPPTGKYRTE